MTGEVYRGLGSIAPRLASAGAKSTWLLAQFGVRKHANGLRLSLTVASISVDALNKTGPAVTQPPSPVLCVPSALRGKRRGGYDD